MIGIARRSFSFRFFRIQARQQIRQHRATVANNDVRFGSEADMCAANSDVRFTPDSDRKSGLPKSRVCFTPENGRVRRKPS
jgi:hypothetical protein